MKKIASPPSGEFSRSTSADPSSPTSSEGIVYLEENQEPPKNISDGEKIGRLSVGIHLGPCSAYLRSARKGSGHKVTDTTMYS